MTALENFKLNNTNITLFTNDEASGAIKSYIKTKSINTAKNYQDWFNDYLLTITSSDINSITWEEIIKITYTDSATYQQYLINKGNSNKTINQKMGAIKSMFKFLCEKYPNHNISSSAISVVDLPVSAHQTNSYGILEEDEVYSLFDYCLEQVKYKPKSQQLFFEVLYTTALRFDAVRTLTTDNISHIVDPKSKQKVYIIKVVDKSKDRTIAITDALALRLLSEPNNNDIVFKINNPNRIFEFGDKSLRATLDKFCLSNNIDAIRNITLHSIKKAAVNNALEITNGNITQVAIYAGHSSPNTTLQYYANKNTSYMEQISMNIQKDDNDMVKLGELSKEELLRLIEGSGVGTIKKLVRMIK